jgi:hypothetical protein
MTGLQILLGWLAQGWQAWLDTHTQTILLASLGLVLIWSAIAKLRQPVLAALAIVDFGVLKRADRWVGLMLGMLEFSLGVVLLVGLVPHIAAAGAFVMFVAFTALIGRALRHGKAFACYCFGDASAKLSRLTLFRSAALATTSGLMLMTLLMHPLDLTARTSAEAILHGVSAMALVAGVFVFTQLALLFRREQRIWRLLGKS